MTVSPRLLLPTIALLAVACAELEKEKLPQVTTAGPHAVPLCASGKGLTFPCHKGKSGRVGVGSRGRG